MIKLAIVSLFFISLHGYTCTRDYDLSIRSLPDLDMMLEINKKSEVAFIGKVIETYKEPYNSMSKQGVFLEVLEVIKGNLPQKVNASFYSTCGYRMLLPKYDNSIEEAWPFQKGSSYLLLGSYYATGEFSNNPHKYIFGISGADILPKANATVGAIKMLKVYSNGR